MKPIKKENPAEELDKILKNDKSEQNQQIAMDTFQPSMTLESVRKSGITDFLDHSKFIESYTG